MTDKTPSAGDPAKKSLTDRETYNLVTDTVVGPNIRLKDNLLQGACVLIGLILGAAIGALAVPDRVPGALVGGFLGLLFGLFGSGMFLMIYRATKHVRGKHD